jgi:glycosyltransferase involved in cell wall biosynthesis
MKIAYLDLNEDDFIEDYSLTPNKYGGGRIIAASLLDKLKDFFIYSNIKSFDNIDFNKKNQCLGLDLNSRRAIKSGLPLKNYIKNADEYDIFFHHHADVFLNLENCKSQKQAVWPVGWAETVHPKTKNILLFDPEVQAAKYSEFAKIYKIVIGPRFEKFQEYKKEDFIFQCSRHCNEYQSIQLAQLCNKYKINIYFSGPIVSGYPLLEFINNQNSFYLGSISQELKRDFFKKAKANVQIQTYPISATLTGKEAGSYGVPIMASEIGGWKNYIKHGINGFFIKNEEDFINSWNNLHAIKQENCYNLALNHSEDKMVELVVKSLQDIYNN